MESENHAAEPDESATIENETAVAETETAQPVAEAETLPAPVKTSIVDILSVDIPKYKSNKPVGALKIGSIDEEPETIDEKDRIITPADGGYNRFRVSGTYIRIHQPKVGGYFIISEEGILAFMDAYSFEGKYSPESG